MFTKIAALASVLALVTAGSAVAQDFRSPDAKPVIVKQDFRSPDAKPIATRSFVQVEPTSSLTTDLRSPDARPSGQYVSSVPQAASPSSSNSFNWAYVAIGIGLAGVIGIAAAIAERRRHRLAIGS